MKKDSLLIGAILLVIVGVFTGWGIQVINRPGLPTWAARDMKIIMVVVAVVIGLSIWAIVFTKGK